MKEKRRLILSLFVYVTLVVTICFSVVFNKVGATCLTTQELEYMKQLMGQGYSAEQAYDEILEQKGAPCLYGTGGIDGINKYGTFNGGGSVPSTPPQTPQAPKHTHSWTYEVIVEGNCITKEVVRQTCSCGETKEVTNDYGDHQYSTREDTKATCITYHKVTFICAICGDTYETEFPDEGYSDHIYIPTEDGREPTCEEPGVIKYVCNVCFDSYEEEVESLGHLYEEYTVDKPATCEEPGLKSIHCSRKGCDAIKEGSEVVIPPKGHTEADKPIVEEATFFKDGKKTYLCRDCGKELREEVIHATGGIWRFIIPASGVLAFVLVISLIIIFSKKKGK